MTNKLTYHPYKPIYEYLSMILPLSSYGYNDINISSIVGDCIPGESFHLVVDDGKIKLMYSALTQMYDKELMSVNLADKDSLEHNTISKMVEVARNYCKNLTMLRRQR